MKKFFAIMGIAVAIAVAFIVGSMVQKDKVIKYEDTKPAEVLTLRDVAEGYMGYEHEGVDYDEIKIGETRHESYGTLTDVYAYQDGEMVVCASINMPYYRDLLFNR